jgi:hypothetical protein
VQRVAKVIIEMTEVSEKFWMAFETIFLSSGFVGEEGEGEGFTGKANEELMVGNRSRQRCR